VNQGIGVFARAFSGCIRRKGAGALRFFKGTDISYPGSPERLLGRVAAGSEQALGDPRGVWRGERCGRQVSTKNGQCTRYASVLQWVCIFLEGWR